LGFFSPKWPRNFAGTMSHNSNLPTLLPYSRFSKHILHLKQRLVLHKTTCHFLKTTACFIQNNVSFSVNTPKRQKFCLLSKIRSTHSSEITKFKL